MSHNKIETDKEWNSECSIRMDSKLKILSTNLNKGVQCLDPQETEESSLIQGVGQIPPSRLSISLPETSIGSDRFPHDYIRNDFTECSEKEMAIGTMDIRSSISVPRLKRREILDNVYPIKKHFLLKISGVWEDSENIGLTYKFEFISVNDLM